MKTTRKQGFTLIELLIVIAIIGILAVAFLPSLLGAPAKGRDTARVADLQKIQKVLVNANLAGDTYPTDTGCIGVAPTLAAYVAEFGGVVPKDPLSDKARYFGGATPTCTGGYYYKSAPTDYAFGLYANVEEFATANTECDDALGGKIVAPVEGTTAANNLCYAILTQ